MKETLASSRFHVLLIGILAFLLYCPTLAFDYAQDDAIVFTDNQFVEQGLKGIPDILTKDTFYGFFKEEGKEKLVEGGRYRPASVVTFAIEHALWGKNSFLSHLINVLMYSLFCMLLYLFTKHIVDRTTLKEHSKWVALVVAVLFVCHPVHTEVVANVKGRDELMVGLFGIGAMVLLFVAKRNILNYVLALMAILVSYFSKEHALVFAVIIPLTVYFFYSKDPDKVSLYIKAFGLSAVAIVFYIARQSILGDISSAPSGELMNNPFLKYVDGKLVHFTAHESWATIIYNLGKYVQLMVFPHPLTADYYPYHIRIKDFGNMAVWGSIIVHVAVGALAIFGLLKQRAWAYGLIFYAGFLFLMTNILFNIGTNLSERFLFLPSFGLLFALVFGGFLFLGKRSASPIIIGVFILICSLFSAKTIVRSQAWKNDFTLLTTDVLVSTNSAKALHGAAGALSSKAGNTEDQLERKRLAEKSNGYLQRALEIHPRYANAHLIMANNFQYMLDYESAVKSYNVLLNLEPENQRGLANLHIAYKDGGRYYGEQKGDLQKSMAYLQQAYNLRPSDYETVRLLGVSNGIAGRNDEAIKYFEEAVKLKPNEAFAYYNLGNAYYITGNEEMGLLNHTKAVEIDPSIREKIKK